jgi:serine/threonine protein kinase
VQGRFEFLRPKRTSLARRVPEADPGMLDFLQELLQVDPALRPTAAEALCHPWLQHQY